jgi:hypothetical protein
MMAAPVVLVFVARDAVVESHFTRQAATGEKFQSPIDRRKADARIGLPDQPVQFINREMFASLKERSQYGVALLGLLQTDAAKMAKKNSFGFADVLPRDARLIVDSFLQHVVSAQTEVNTARRLVKNMILGQHGFRQSTGLGPPPRAKGTPQLYRR